MQVRRRHLVPAFEQAGRITKRRNHVKHDHLRVKAPREPSGLEEGMPGHVGGHNGNKNFLKAQHRAKWCATGQTVWEARATCILVRLHTGLR
jgi:hypothetical protein